MEQSQERVTAQNVTLDNCDREEIQYSNAVQPHVVLLTVEVGSLRILQASANADELGQGKALDLVGQTLRGCFRKKEQRELYRKLPSITKPEAPLYLGRGRFGDDDRDLFAHMSDGVLLLEFECIGPNRKLSESELYAQVRGGISRLSATNSIAGFLDSAVRLVAQCTGFERVMAYRFDPDGSGEVMAEAVADGLDRYLGLHYPAADIPLPARRLFAMSWVRHLPNVGYKPVPILPVELPSTGDLVDLSRAASRSVSVMYTEYLQNMGVQATLVLTLLKKGELWGLVSCMHHSAPRHLNVEVRGACELLAQFLSQLMSSKEDAALAGYRESLSDSLTKLMDQAVRQATFIAALTAGSHNLLTAMDADGAAVVVDGKIQLLGETPSEAAVRTICLDIEGRIRDVWHTDDPFNEPSGRITADPSTLDHASGILATRIGRSGRDLILWFRPEYRQTVSWAGDPSKKVVRGGERETRLRPDGSFDVWRSEIRGKSKAWLECEISFAVELGRGIREVVREKARQVTLLNQSLARTDQALDEFVHAASHDLRTPLRAIHNQTQQVLRNNRELLRATDLEKLERVIQHAQRMDRSFEALLDYSDVGHAPMVIERVDMNDVANHVIEMLQGKREQAGAEVRILGTLPTVEGDLRRIRQALLHLITNALQYSDKTSRWVEIGCQEVTPGRESTGRDRSVFFVRDNGIGIAQSQFESIFRLFRRLHAGDPFGGGTGVGLSIAKRAIESHDGKLWLQSEPGVGSTFYFTLQSGVGPDGG